MNQTIDFLNSHASARNFADRDISEEDERLIVTTAQRSPTSSNLQAYSIISIREQAVRDKLAALAGGQRHVAACSLFLVFCADLYRLSKLNQVRGSPFNGASTESFVVAIVDASLAAGRALMAAQALGMGGVMVGGIRNHPEEVADLLKLPDLVAPVMGMSLGYPATMPKVKPRLPTEAICFRETYDDTTVTAAVEQYDKAIDELGWLKGREVKKANYADFDGVYSWSEHSARRMASTATDVQRPHLAAFLRKRGFLKDSSQAAGRRRIISCRPYWHQPTGRTA